MFQNMSEN